MSERIPVCLVVGANRVDTLSRKYVGNAKDFLDLCRRTAKKHARIFTKDPRVVVAFQALHALGEVELHVQHLIDGVQEFSCDDKGDFIQPWPDEFFEIEFALRFHYKEL